MFGLALACSNAWALSGVTVPAVVVAGDDFATQQLGNAWDMSDSADIDIEESGGVSNQTFSGGLFSGLTTSGNNALFPLFMGYAGSANVSRGFTHPIDTTHYRYFTFKIRESRSGEVALLTFLQGDTLSYNNGTCGQTSFASPLPASSWIIYTFDLYTNIASGPVCAHQWTDFPTVTGLQFAPALDGTAGGGTQFDIDWMRLTAAATNAQKTQVTWSDSASGAYTITLNDVGANPVSVALGTAVSGSTSFMADLTPYPAGQYTITVARTGATSTSATFRINAAPQPAMTSPDQHGDTTQDFATTQVGNAWGPMDAGDFSNVLNFASVNYSTFPNAFYGRPSNSDPEWFMNLGGHAIDAGFYRSLCFNMEVFGPRSIGSGSVARVFWGSPGNLTTSQDIILHDNVNDTLVSEYCFADLAQLALETSPPQNGGLWTGTKTQLRIDPDEFTPPGGCNTADTCHDVRLNSVRLSPFMQANPGFTFGWNVLDTDDANVTVSVYLDPDTTPGNGNEILVHSASVAAGAGTFAWAGSRAVNYGTYQVYLVANDGRNSVGQYANGPLVVGARDGIFRNGFDPIP